jgi:hypothetical protein
MTHLAPNSTATAREKARSTLLHPLRAFPAKPVFYRRMANFLEMAVAAFHYSVTGGYAAIDMAPGLASRPRLIDDVTASAARGDAADARTREKRRFKPLRPVAASARRKKERCKGQRFC